MTYLQQQLLIPQTNAEELKFLGGLVQSIAAGDTEQALNSIMARMVSIEHYGGSRLADYTPQLEAKPQ